MAKDWEYWKEYYMTVSTMIAEEEIKMIESSDTLSTPIEKICGLYLLLAIKKMGGWSSEFYWQYPIGPYRADFMLKYGDLKIVVECDGHEFHEKTKEQAAKDKKRDREMQKLGYVVLRYTGSEIVKDPTVVFTDLEKLIETSKRVEDSERSVSNE